MSDRHLVRRRGTDAIVAWELCDPDWGDPVVRIYATGFTKNRWHWKFVPGWEPVREDRASEGCSRGLNWIAQHIEAIGYRKAES